MWELKIHVISYLIQIYFLTKYLVENTEISISETLEYKIFWGSMMPPDPSRGSRLPRSLLWTSPKHFLGPPLQITLRRPCRAKFFTILWAKICQIVIPMHHQEYCLSLCRV